MPRWSVRTVTRTITRTVSRTISMTTLALSYDQLAARLGIAVPSARRLVHRKRWSKGKGNDGRAIVQVPAEFFDGREDGPSDNQDDSACCLTKECSRTDC